MISIGATPITWETAETPNVGGSLIYSKMLRNVDTQTLGKFKNRIHAEKVRILLKATTEKLVVQDFPWNVHNCPISPMGKPIDFR